MTLYLARFNRETPGYRHDDALGKYPVTFKEGDQLQIRKPPAPEATTLYTLFAEPPDIDITTKETP